MGRKILRIAGLVGYGVALLVLFTVAAYSAFNLFVRSGVTRTPDVVGLTQSEAVSLLAEQGLVWDRQGVESRYSEEVPAGGVVAQRPGSSSLVKRGSRVELVLSLGPQRLMVPDLRGQALPAAQVALSAAGLALGRTLEIYSPRAQPGSVVDQQPAAMTMAAPEAPIDLLIAREGGGELYIMPDLVYRRYSDVKRFFERRGLRLGSVRFEPYESVPDGVILRQFPLAGHPLSRRDAVSLVVAASETPEP